MSCGARFLVLIVAIAFASMSSTARAETIPIPPGHEAQISAVLYGGHMPLEIGEGWQAGAASIVFDRIEVALLAGGEPRGHLLLTLGGGSLDGRRLGSTASFTVWSQGDIAAEASRAIERFVADLSSRDDGSLLERIRSSALVRATGSANRSGRGTAIGAPGAASGTRLLRWAALLCLLCFVFAGATVPERRAPTPVLLACAALFTVALALRLGLPAWAPLHANSHGIDELRGLAGNGPAFGAFTEVELYSTAWREVTRAVLDPLGGAAHAALAFTAVIGALSTVLLAAAASRLLGGWAAGLFAGALLALHPAHIILSLSESPWPLAMALWVLALWSGAVALQRDSGRLAWIGICALALASACELRLFTLALPVSAVVVLLGVSGWRRLGRGDWLGIVLSAGLIGWTAFAHLRSVEPFIDDTARRWGFLYDALGALSSPKSLLMHADLTPMGLVVAAVAGSLLFAFARRGGPRLAAALWMAFVVLLLPAFTVIACRTDLIRYQTQAQIVLCVLAAAIVPVCCDEQGRLRRPVAVLIALALVVATAVPGWIEARRRTPDEAAFELVAREAADLPAELRVRVAPHLMVGGLVRSDFPEYLLAERGARVQVLEQSDSSERETRNERSATADAGIVCYAYIAPDCYDFTGDERGDERRDDLGVEAGAELSDALASASVGFEGGRLRRECAPLIAGIAPGADLPLAARVEVPWPHEEFHYVGSEHPLVGFVPCATRRP